MALTYLAEIPIRYLQFPGKQFHLDEKKTTLNPTYLKSILCPLKVAFSISLFLSTVVQIHYPIPQILELDVFEIRYFQLLEE